MSDITITEKSLINSWGDYNPKGKTISSEFVEKLDKTGEYVIAQGKSSNTSLDIAQPTYNIGDTINFNGKTYEVMAIVEAPYPVTEGKVEAGSEFNLSFFIPTSCFQELFPENTPRKLLINVDTDKRRSVEGVIDEYIEKEGLPVKTEKEVEEFFKSEIMSEMLLPSMVACIIVIISIVNLINAIITLFYSRKKEFTMFQGIGMTQKKLKALLAFEGINIAVITLILSYFISFVVISTGVKAYVETQWTAAYQLTITPLLIATPILILICILVPMECLKRMQQVDIIERLYEGEDMDEV